jgi:hypothetical protein
VAKKQPMTRTQRAYIEKTLANVERKRSQSFCEADVERLLEQMQSEDEVTRAQAVRHICPCRMPWEVFERLRKAAKPLQKDPSPQVRADALHIEEDARLVAGFEAQMERVREYEEGEESAYRAKKRHKPQRQR